MILAPDASQLVSPLTSKKCPARFDKEMGVGNPADSNRTRQPYCYTHTPPPGNPSFGGIDALRAVCLRAGILGAPRKDLATVRPRA